MGLDGHSFTNTMSMDAASLVNQLFALDTQDDGIWGYTPKYSHHVKQGWEAVCAFKQDPTWKGSEAVPILI